MAFVGNINGPRESEIVEKLGPEYFGITWQKLENEIQWYKDTEQRKEVVPVHIDDEGEPCIIFSSPDKKGQRFYLKRVGYQLIGQIKTFTEEEQKRWKGKL